MSRSRPMVAPDADVAAWAAQPIKLGPGLSLVTPLVLAPTDEELARRAPELAVLSARAHGNGPNGLKVVMAALAALEQFDPDTAGVYLTIIYDALREPARRALEALLMERQTLGPVTLPPFAQRLENKGKADGMRAVLLKLVKRSDISLSTEDLARIEACTDVATLDRWIDNLFTATSAADIFR